MTQETVWEEIKRPGLGLVETRKGKRRRQVLNAVRELVLTAIEKGETSLTVREGYLNWRLTLTDKDVHMVYQFVVDMLGRQEPLKEGQERVVFTSSHWQGSLLLGHYQTTIRWQTGRGSV